MFQLKKTKQKKPKIKQGQRQSKTVDMIQLNNTEKDAIVAV